MPLNDLLIETASRYFTYRQNPTVDKNDPAYDLVEHQFPAELERLAGGQRKYIYKGSTGQGNITPAPWIAIFDPRVTESAQGGFYVVFLFSTDLLRVTLSLALGVTEFANTYGDNKKMLAPLKAAAERLSEILEIPDPFQVGQIDLDAPKPTSLHGKYERSNIACIEYDLTDLPAEEVLQRDLQDILALYDQLYIKGGSHLDKEQSIQDASISTSGKPTISFYTPRKKKERRKSSSTNAGSRRRSKDAKKIGDAAEKIVLEFEKDRLNKAGRTDLAEKIIWVADEKKSFPGYDILSFEEDGTERWIEVKGTKSDRMSSLELTDNEYRCALEAPRGMYHIYIVTKVFRNTSSIEIMKDPVMAIPWSTENPKPSVWNLSL
jgi:hypothetical protein